MMNDWTRRPSGVLVPPEPRFGGAGVCDIVGMPGLGPRTRGGGAPAPPPTPGPDLFRLYNTSSDNSIADRSSFARPVTMTGSIGLDGSSPAWAGTKRMVWPGSGNNWLSVPHDDRLYLTTAAWTVEAMVRIVNGGRTNIIINKRYNAWPNNGWSLHVNDQNMLVWEIGVNGEGMVSSSPVPLNTDVFVSAVKKDGTLGLHIGGNPVGSKGYTYAPTSDTSPLFVGVNGYQDGASSPLGSNITAVRINDTVARYTPGVSYTPPTSV